jgi:hypothetical protein
MSWKNGYRCAGQGYELTRHDGNGYIIDITENHVVVATEFGVKMFRISDLEWMDWQINGHDEEFTPNPWAIKSYAGHGVFEIQRPLSRRVLQRISDKSLYALFLESGRYDYFVYMYTSGGYLGVNAYDPSTRTPEVQSLLFP